MARIGLAVILAVGFILVANPSEAQKPENRPRLGILSVTPLPSEPGWQQRAPFWRAMNELGWIEGQNILVERRFASWEVDRLTTLATELLQLKVDVILTTSGAEAIVAKRMTTTVPIVMVTSLDAVEQGLVVSLARPGGNVTGLTSMTSELSRKRLELLREMAPNVSRVAVLQCKGLGLTPQGLEGTLAAASVLGIHTQLLEVREADDYEIAFATAIRQRADGMVVLSCFFTGLIIIESLLWLRNTACRPYTEGGSRWSQVGSCPMARASLRCIDGRPSMWTRS